MSAHVWLIVTLGLQIGVAILALRIGRETGRRGPWRLVAAAMLRRLIDEDVRLSFDQENDLGKVRVDAGQVEQVILNLAVNAREAMSGGGCGSLGSARHGNDPAGRG